MTGSEQRRLCVALAAAGAVLCVAAAVRAHDPAKALSLVWKDGDSAEPSVIVSNRGLVFASAPAKAGQGDAFALRCNEAYDVSTAERPAASASAGESLLLSVYHGSYLTADDACTLQVVDGLPDASWGAPIAVGDELLVANRTAEESAGVYASDDGGARWTLRYPNEAGHFFQRLLPAPSDARRAYAQDFGAGARSCASSSDAGRSWTSRSLSADATLLAVHPGDADVVFAYVPADIDGHYRLLRSDDACQSFTWVEELGGKPAALAAGADPAVLWLGVEGVGLYVSRDEGVSFAQVRADEIVSVDCVETRGEVLWLCATAAPNESGVFFLDDPANTNSPLRGFMTFADVTRPVVCDDPGDRAVCAGPWFDFLSEHQAAAEQAVEGSEMSAAGGAGGGLRGAAAGVGEGAGAREEPVVAVDAGAAGVARSAAGSASAAEGPVTARGADMGDDTRRDENPAPSAASGCRLQPGPGRSDLPAPVVTLLAALFTLRLRSRRRRPNRSSYSAG